ncbi:FAD-dependent monooxygenase [Actinoplanes couchii]|uniref:FAD-dependent oxidoreductase n=1 Tax=Actinoplanes couchii TaxID=403638 RepID=A0ABQ3XKJ4_9ACTN|nr:FAD-dependent monooxygenase [Actinoplanes couchii]MDR6319581.1 2-polyprenyl-6-methoxyphenol hydroxylase-like FAD-dependent oxidoreductase [Actinoplanes couchii]GID59028.1 FAD-dependent oxidoreductase [Actinoplanes couchii]
MSRVLVSGASIAGPALAYWLHRHGFDVTVVEKSDTIRGGGYPIDIRGTALEVVRRMGLMPRLRDAHINTERLTFLEPDGSPIASVKPDAVVRGTEGNDLEIPRGDLTTILYDAVRDDVEFVFGDSISTLDEHPDRIDVTFRSGAQRTFDLVIGADGLHSNTRALRFGPEEQYHRYLGHCFAGFTMPNDLGLSREGVTWCEPGRGAALYAVGDGDQVHGFLTFRRPDPPFDAFRDPRAQRDLVASVFAGDGWEIPRMVAVMREAGDLFFDVVSQIRMPRWSSGRVALAGDAAHAPSFVTGQGTSLGLVGAYMLATALAGNDHHEQAFGGYERDTRPFIEANQDLAGNGGSVLFPATAEALAARNAMLRGLTTIPAEAARPEYSALVLPS